MGKVCALKKDYARSLDRPCPCFGQTLPISSLDLAQNQGNPSPVKSEDSGELGDGGSGGAVDVGDDAGFSFEGQGGEVRVEPALTCLIDRFIEFRVRLHDKGFFLQLVLHFGNIDTADGLQVIGRVAVEDLFQVGMVADAVGDEPPRSVQQPGSTFQRFARVKKLPSFPLGEGGNRHPAWSILPEHRQVAGPGVIDNIAPIVQCVPGDIGQCVPQVRRRVEPQRLDFDASQNAILTIFPLEIHRIHLFALLSEGLGILPLRGESGGVGMIRHDGIGNDDHIVPPGTNGQRFDHHVIILIIPAQHRSLQTFQTNMVRFHSLRTPIGQFSDNTSFHRYYSIAPGKHRALRLAIQAS